MRAAAATIGSRQTGSSSPISAIAAFTGMRVRFDEIHVHQRQILALELARCCEIAVEGSRRKPAHFRRNLVRGHRDDAASAERDQRQRDRIVARQAR